MYLSADFYRYYSKMGNQKLKTYSYYMFESVNKLYL